LCCFEPWRREQGQISGQTGQDYELHALSSLEILFFFFFVTRETEAEMTNAVNLSTFFTDIFGLLGGEKQAYIFLSLKLSNSLSKLNVETLSEG